jgi:hypothetical protein
LIVDATTGQCCAKMGISGFPKIVQENDILVQIKIWRASKRGGQEPAICITIKGILIKNRLQITGQNAPKGIGTHIAI